MDDMDAAQIGTLGPQSPDSIERPRKVSRLLLLWPLAGFVLVAAAVMRYPPLDDGLIWCSGAAPCMIVYTLINVAWRKEKSGGAARFLPGTVWLAVGSLCVPIALFLNGTLDQSRVEQHRQVITGRLVRYHRGQAYYSLELESWRAGHTHEKVMVSEQWYLQAKPGDRAIVETHSGALGISLLVSVHRPD